MKLKEKDTNNNCCSSQYHVCMIPTFVSGEALCKGSKLFGVADGGGSKSDPAPTSFSGAE